MRAFLAIQLPEETKGALAAAQRGIEAGAPGFYRWTGEAQMHLTLYFLGNVETVEGLVERIATNVPKQAEFSLALGGLVLLPEPRVPRIVAAGVGGDTDALRRLQQRVSDCVFPVAENKETRGFSPHVTIGRLKRGMPGNAKQLKRTLAAAGVPETAPFPVTEFELVSSALGPGGSKYETVHRFSVA